MESHPKIEIFTVREWVENKHRLSHDNKAYCFIYKHFSFTITNERAMLFRPIIHLEPKGKQLLCTKSLILD